MFEFTLVNKNDMWEESEVGLVRLAIDEAVTKSLVVKEYRKTNEWIWAEKLIRSLIDLEEFIYLAKKGTPVGVIVTLAPRIIKLALKRYEEDTKSALENGHKYPSLKNYFERQFRLERADPDMEYEWGSTRIVASWELDRISKFAGEIYQEIKHGSAKDGKITEGELHTMRTMIRPPKEKGDIELIGMYYCPKTKRNHFFVKEERSYESRADFISTAKELDKLLK